MGRNFLMPEKGIPSEKCTKNDALLLKAFPATKKQMAAPSESCNSPPAPGKFVSASQERSER
jgi:hypothetical protein